MSKITLTYSTKIWLTSVFIGAVIYWLLASPHNATILSFGEYMAFILPGGVILSIPSFLLLWAGTSYIIGKPKFRQKKLLIAIWALVLTATPFLILFGNDDPNTGSASSAILGCVSYLVPILAGIFFYRLPLHPDKDLTAI